MNKGNEFEPTVIVSGDNLCCDICSYVSTGIACLFPSTSQFNKNFVYEVSLCENQNQNMAESNNRIEARDKRMKEVFPVQAVDG